MGFNIARYVRKHGSTAEIRIGVNGELTKDEFLTSYLSECKQQLRQDELDSSSESEDGDTETESDIFEGVDLLPNRNPQKPSPLCWEDQLEKVEVGHT